ncbi:MAG TPA: prepilin-type N-terminal cleavage/methylation domain-containing protein [Smithellaceae bacterium]|jgi:prepilin-type N-terminal cleavage/methylation domain-containing protein|nr:prepilin-type N-terminal cleavage/methylation domain-containing protein [Smithellaceae bacterium]HPL65448.1 prepilin-type N-terminal cleavage/methylation domain-containing protein [Smithellaceae bacterium]
MNKNGFTLIELIMAISIGLVIIAAVYALNEMGQRSSASISQKVVTQQDARAVLDLMAMEIRMASYNPSGKDNSTGNEIWVDKDGVAITAANNKKFMKGIQIAKTNEIMIEMDLHGDAAASNPDGFIKCSQSNEVIHYKFDSATKTISRITNCGINASDTQVILGGTGSNTMVRNDAAPAVNLFTYWGPDIDNPDANGNCADIDITDKVSSNVAATAEKWIPQIRQVIITIVADNERPDATSKQIRRMTYSTGVTVRNHVLSPPIAN